MNEVDHRAVGPGSSWWFVTAVGVLIGGALGFVTGVSGPVFGVGIGAGLVAGPTSGGILLVLAILTAAGSGLVALARTVFGHTGRTAGSIFCVSLALVGGTFVGAAVGNSADIAGWAPGPTPSPRSSNFPSFSPAPPTLEANATVTLALDEQAGFVATEPEPMGDGRFGQWCHSEPGGFVVSEVETSEVGRLAGYPVRITLWLTDPQGLASQWNVPVPRIAVEAWATNDGTVGFWRGRVIVVADEGTNGTARFSTLQRDDGWPEVGLPATLSGEVAWACGSWQAP
jgi:hypothetical protein